MNKRTLLFIPIAWITFVLITTGTEIYELGDGRFGTREEVVSEKAESGGLITITAASYLSGKLYINVGDNNEARFSYKKIIKTSSHSKAIDYADLIQVELQKSIDGLNLLLRSPNPAPWSSSDEAGIIEGNLDIPAGSRIEVDADYFDLIVDGPFSSVKNEGSFGQIDAQNIQDRIELTTTSRDISLKDIKGEVVINTTNADIRIKNMVTSFEPARIKNENGNILIDGATGSFVVRSSFGKIRLSGIQLVGENTRIIGNHCPIRMEIEKLSDAYLAITNNYEDVELAVPKDLSANFSLEVNPDGEIHVVDIPVKPLQVTRNRMEMVSGDGEGQITIDLGGNADISIEGVR
nr:hypothetical protein [candidate division Zixibacteria bacterium]